MLLLVLIIVSYLIKTRIGDTSEHLKMPFRWLTLKGYEERRKILFHNLKGTCKSYNKTFFPMCLLLNVIFLKNIGYDICSPLLSFGVHENIRPLSLNRSEYHSIFHSTNISLSVKWFIQLYRIYLGFISRVCKVKLVIAVLIRDGKLSVNLIKNFCVISHSDCSVEMRNPTLC